MMNFLKKILKSLKAILETIVFLPLILVITIIFAIGFFRRMIFIKLGLNKSIAISMELTDDSIVKFQEHIKYFEHKDLQ